MVNFDQPTGSAASSEPGMLERYSRLLKKYGVLASGYWPGERRSSVGSNSSSRSSSEIRKSSKRDTQRSMGPIGLDGETVLTDAQYQAFQEAFELFDKNGGGTIDAAELQKTLDDCGIYVNGDDLVEIMLSLDHDGNGEVDFDEFLNLMTNTDVFLEVLNKDTDHSEAKREARKRVVLFDALTEFLKKQALKGANEIIGYYSKKYKTVHHYGTGMKGAHVVGHYADVARLVGLTENELYTQLKELKQHTNLNNGDLSSPYAQSFHLGLLKSIEEDRRRKPPVKPVGLGGPKLRNKSKLPPIHKQRNTTQRFSDVEGGPRVTLRVVGLDRMSQKVHPENRKTFRLNSEVINSELAKRSQVSQLRERRKSLGAVLANHNVDLPIPHRPGWYEPNHQHIKVVDLDIRIVPGWSKVPISEVAELKQITRYAQNSYFTNVACEKLASNLQFYRCLNTRKPPSKDLYNTIKGCMVSYSSATTDDTVGRVGPIALNRVFATDDSKSWRRKSDNIKSKRSQFIKQMSGTHL